MSLAARILTLAESQQGLVTRRQLLDAEVPPRTLDRWTASDRLARVHEGVFRVVGGPVTPDQPLLAAVLACGPPSVASHRGALGHWGAELRAPAPVEVAVVRESAPRLRGVIVHRSSDLHPDHTTVLRGIPVTTPARTLLDAGHVLPWWEVEAALESMLRRGLVTLDQVQAALVLHAKRGRRGVGALRRVLRERALDDRPADSVLEATFARLCRAAGMPEPVLHPEVVVDGVVLHPDFGFPGTPVLVELDGWAHHGDRTAFERDRQRDQLLVAAGHQVLRFTWRQVVHQPHRVVATLRQVLSADAATLLGK